MVSPNVNRIYQAVEALTEAERDELRQLIESRARRQPVSVKLALNDEQRKQHRRRDFQPIELPGGPLSDDIIRDRR